MARALRAWAINRGGKYSVRNLRYGPQTRLVRGIYSLCPPSFFLSLSLFSFPTTESLEQAVLIMTHKTHASLYFFLKLTDFLTCLFFFRLLIVLACSFWERILLFDDFHGPHSISGFSKPGKWNYKIPWHSRFSITRANLEIVLSNYRAPL